jgi:hypothetical protein
MLMNNVTKTGKDRVKATEKQAKMQAEKQSDTRGERIGFAESNVFVRLGNRFGLGLRARLLIIFIAVKVLPIVLVAIIAWMQLIA